MYANRSNAKVVNETFSSQMMIKSLIENLITHRYLL